MNNFYRVALIIIECIIVCFHNSTYRLDQILGKQGSKAKDVYASKISLASRVVKVERSVSFFFSLKYTSQALMHKVKKLFKIKSHLLVLLIHNENITS